MNMGVALNLSGFMRWWTSPRRIGNGEPGGSPSYGVRFIATRQSLDNHERSAPPSSQILASVAGFRARDVPGENAPASKSRSESGAYLGPSGQNPSSCHAVEAEIGRHCGSRAINRRVLVK